eukprot:Gregarina_sp_Pseudo_9__1531@NODE_2028_length_1194_cov_103_174026_g1873_i0_p2_GENE_NODE_2028_length_1194_cov_103_174026_g1873_i0NODE_2028_length_1194_cov_103_174026_g1873_i0_p2_ORF_typecomplete_len136_score22_74_NODE_2028_length_1194_cov_103_174026_g1873_i07861193
MFLYPNAPVSPVPVGGMDSPLALNSDETDAHMIDGLLGFSNSVSRPHLLYAAQPSCEAQITSYLPSGLETETWPGILGNYQMEFPAMSSPYKEEPLRPEPDSDDYLSGSVRQKAPRRSKALDDVRNGVWGCVWVG